MASTIEQQIAAEKKRIAGLKKRAESAAAAANATAAGKASSIAIKKQIAEYESRLNYINTRVAPYVEKLAKGEKLTSTEKNIFDGLSSEFNSLKSQLTNIKFPGAVKSDTPPPPAANQGGPTGTPVQAPEPTPTPAQTPKPSTGGGATGGNTGGTPGKAIPSNFNVGSFRKADEASMGGTDGITPKPVGSGTSLDTLLAKTEFWYDLPDYIFKVDKKIGDILVQAVNENWDSKKFMSKVQLTPWWQKNADTIRTKIIDREKYNDLRKSGEDVSKTDYGIYLGKQMRFVKNEAQKLANVTLTDAQAQEIAQKIYDGNLEDDALAIQSLIVPFIGKTTSIVGNGLKSTGFGGKALLNYQALQELAKRNGFTLKDILPNISAITAGGDIETAVLRGLADGSLDINRIAQDARMLAAQGQPQYVRDLLGQGYDLEGIYSPYREQMARELDLNVNQIDLNDPTLRMAITDKGDMNIYDFKKVLRKDNRWQYSSAANQEVASSVLGVLRDFGFQG
jgi:hypothetical protein